jgi:hypothetical protein
LYKCDAETCSLDLASLLTTPLANGDYNWGVHGVGGSCGAGLSRVATFTVQVPAKPTLISPNGDTTGPKPIFRWGRVPFANSYTLRWSPAPSSAVPEWQWNELWSISDGSACSNDECQKALSQSLSCGKSYVWTMEAVSGTDHSDFAELGGFYVSGDKPDRPGGLRVEPTLPNTATTTTFTPTLRWSAQNGATNYEYVVRQLNPAKQMAKGVVGAGVCNAGSCSVKLAQQLSRKAHTLGVRALNACGWGDSSTFNFNVNPPCGNGVCETNETPENSCGDCHCGNGDCEISKSENHDSCPQDCGCGDGVCDHHEGQAGNCSADCKCGNGVCETWAGETCIFVGGQESVPVCPADCPADLCRLN